MGDKATHFNSIDEARWGGIPPVVKGFFGGEVVEAVIDLHRGELPHIEAKPFRLGETLRVEPSSPMFIAPPTCPYTKLHLCDTTAIATFLIIIQQPKIINNSETT